MTWKEIIKDTDKENWPLDIASKLNDGEYGTLSASDHFVVENLPGGEVIRVVNELVLPKERTSIQGRSPIEC